MTREQKSPWRKSAEEDAVKIFLQKHKDRYRVDNTTGCHLWTGAIDNVGYPSISYLNKTYRVHRLACIAYNGPLTNSKVVRHTCDVRRCINPEHLLNGTHKDNVTDMDTRNRRRSALGPANARTNLSELQAHQIKELLAEGVSVSSVAFKLNVSHAAVYAIRDGRTWNHV